VEGVEWDFGGGCCGRVGGHGSCGMFCSMLRQRVLCAVGYCVYTDGVYDRRTFTTTTTAFSSAGS